jgi:hypothetical protein
MALKLLTFVNLDSGESAIFAQQLEVVQAKAYDVQYPTLKARTFFPLSTEGGSGAETISYYVYDMVGMAKIISDYASDLPSVNVTAKKYTGHIKSGGTSYTYSLQEVRAAKQANAPLDQKRANAAKKALAQLEDDIAINGDAAHNLVGVLTHPNVSEYTVPAGASTETTWADKTADEILADLNGFVSTIIENTKADEAPNTLLLPHAQRQLIATKRLPDNTETVLSFFLRTNEYIKAVETWEKLKGAGDGGADVALCYDRSPETAELRTPQDFEQLPPQEKGLAYLVPCHQRIGGVAVYKPLAMCKAEGS